MKILIDIPKRYKTLLDNGNINESVKKSILLAVANGKPLPNSYGNLIDIDALEDEIFRTSMGDWEILIDYIDNVPIIIKADKESKE